jgi:hypothetical protein
MLRTIGAAKQDTFRLFHRGDTRREECISCAFRDFQLLTGESLMKAFSMLSAVAVVAMLATVASAEDLKSGLQPGSSIGAFFVTKCAGADGDGVDVGDNLCYRCKYGGRPQVMVFTRSTDEKLAKLVKELDKAVADNSAKQLKAFVNIMGEDKKSLTEEATKFGKTTGAKNVPIVVPNEYENGPADYGINPKVDVTVILAAGGKVVASHAYAAGELKVDAIVADIAKIVK